MVGYKLANNASKVAGYDPESSDLKKLDSRLTAGQFILSLPKGGNDKIGVDPQVKKVDKFIVWHSPKGEVIACVEKNKVLRENLDEIRQVCQDALEDAVLMGCDEQQFRIVLSELVGELVNPYPPRE